ALPVEAFVFSSRRRHTSFSRDWSSDVCSSDLATIITKAEYVGNVMTLCIEKRGMITNQTYLSTDRVELRFDMPLAEIVFDFYDRDRKSVVYGKSVGRGGGRGLRTRTKTRC